MSPVRVPAAVLTHARKATQAIGSRAGLHVDAEELIGGRAALLGLQHRGRISAGGATRLMDAPDGWCALTLSRPDDVAAVPALVESDGAADDPWPVIQRRVRVLGARPFAERARLLGLPVGVLGETPAAAITVRAIGERARAKKPAGLLVADLSSMWAGPLCGRLLTQAGATVVKVESPRRPDGTRHGPTTFFDWMNAGKLSYQADFDQPEGLHRLLAVADVVIESSRPAALPRRALGPLDVPARSGRVWIRITGHGTDGAPADWVAFGDDAAVSGGLVGGSAESPEFCGDAIADPLTGIHAARAVLESLDRGGAELIDVSMAAVAAQYSHLPDTGETDCTATPPVTELAAALGTDQELVERIVAERLVASC